MQVLISPTFTLSFKTFKGDFHVSILTSFFKRTM
jgi:hypothetical protein